MIRKKEPWKLAFFVASSNIIQLSAVCVSNALSTRTENIRTTALDPLEQMKLFEYCFKGLFRQILFCFENCNFLHSGLVWLLFLRCVAVKADSITYPLLPYFVVH